MHELSVCRALLHEVETVAVRQGAVGVASITVQIGPLAGVEPDLLQAAYPLASAGSIGEGADLHIEAVPLRVRCDACGSETDATPSKLICGACGNWHTRLISGDELLLTQVALIEAGPSPITFDGNASRNIYQQEHQDV